MVTIMVARFIGDLFNEGLYDIVVRLKAIPFLEWEPPRIMKQLEARHVMASPLVCLQEVERVGNIYDVRSVTSGFFLSYSHGVSSCRR